MSPRRTLISCGSSSRLVRRRNAPMGVTRWSSREACRTGSPGGEARMVRNFRISKLRPPRPPRFWRNSTGPPPPRWTRRAMSSMRGEATSRKPADRPTSRARLLRLETTRRASSARRVRAATRCRSAAPSASGATTSHTSRRSRTGFVMSKFTADCGRLTSGPRLTNRSQGGLPNTTKRAPATNAFPPQDEYFCAQNGAKQRSFCASHPN